MTIRRIDDLQLWLTIRTKGHDPVTDDVVIGVVGDTGRIWVGSVATVMIVYANNACVRGLFLYQGDRLRGTDAGIGGCSGVGLHSL